MTHPIQILERYWNFTQFRPLQEDIITSILDRNDTIVLMPTGGGKSLCFQIPALAQPGICIVISPLIALMEDQVNALKEKGIKAMVLTSGISYTELDTQLDNCIYGNYKFLYISPERLQQDLVKDRIKQMPVNLIAVDEAHCISQWGHDFRPSYRQIQIIRTLHPSAPLMALTATATPAVVEDIKTQLDCISPKIFKQPYNRKNLAYMVLHTEDKLHKVESILKKYKESSIIYVRNRKATVDISNFLTSKNISSSYYHGGLTPAQKTEALHDWLNNRKQVMVATNAFGMGIDKPDVKTVIHLTLPESLESYYQEAGRAGRDGNKAFAIVLNHKNDIETVKHQFLTILPSVAFVKKVYRKLCAYFQIPYGEGMFSVFEFQFNTFCSTYKFNTALAYNAINILDRTSIIQLEKQFKTKTTLQFIVNNNTIFKYLEQNKKLSTIIKTILRTYGGVTEHDTNINTQLISKKTNTSIPHIETVLKQLEKDEIITLNLFNTDAQVTFIEPREDDITINRIAKIIEQQNTLKHNQIQSVINYVGNETTCKSKLLNSYFSDETIENCGICSFCISKNKPETIDFKTIKHKIIQQLEVQALSSRALESNLEIDANSLSQAIKELLEQNIISLTPTNTYKLSHL